MAHGINSRSKAKQGSRGRGGRRPFKSRNNTASYRRALLRKRKLEDNIECEEDNKKFKAHNATHPVKEEDAQESSSSDLSDAEQLPTDSHALLLHSFGASTATHSDPEDDDDEGDDGDGEGDDEGEDHSDDQQDTEDESEEVQVTRQIKDLNSSNAKKALMDEQLSEGSHEQSDDESNDDDNESEESDECNSRDSDSSDDLSDEQEDLEGGIAEDAESDADSLMCASDDENSTSRKPNLGGLVVPTKNQKGGKQVMQCDDEDLDELEKNSLPSIDDPFCTHFERVLSHEAAERLLDCNTWQHDNHQWPELSGAVKHSYPTKLPALSNKPKLLLTADSDAPPPVYGGPFKVPEFPDVNSMFIKDSVLKNIGDLTPLQQHLLHAIANYSDLYYPSSTHEKWDDVTKVYSIHALNHVLKTRTRILKNNSKLSKLRAAKIDVDLDQFRDQGLSRAKVLILLPSKHSAFRVVKAMQKLLGLSNKQQVKHLTRFEDDFGPGDTNTNLPRALKGRSEDFIATFTGDTSENFKIGITVSNKSLGLYSNFSRSDIILASPLGLRLVAGVEGEEDNNAGFLSSIEMLVLDQASCFLMQNWDHVLSVLESVNLSIKNVRDIVSDGRRVRSWSVDGHAKFYRQTLMFSAAIDDLQRALFSRSCNFAGRFEVLPVSAGVLGDLLVSAELVLLRCPGLNDGEQRLAYFTQEFFPKHVASRKAFTLLYIPDTSDYYLLSQFLAQERAIEFSSINEYLTSKMSHVAVARSDFFKGSSPLLLYTERFHYYKRPVIKGIRHLIFYALPSFSSFFSEMCNLMIGSLQNQSAPRSQLQHRSSITVLYQRSDVTRLAAVMGNTNAKELLSSNKNVHMCAISGS
ncbi:U3 small nucleolar RNA-associated protein 25 homolog [Hyalella azteca]|uniref:U3 small nucleolar RNA-associated protein 25 homolog n=1 Tax=Hyalella azteca TaxID=294128 RepID=A0A8B7NTW4_HYAAZ|nr:U3 small nucleolar RNA-associated protein 25 homolog [Hyalella azteca]